MLQILLLHAHAASVIARNRALSHLTKEASSKSMPLLGLVPQVLFVLGSEGVKISSPFQFSVAPHAELGNLSRGRGYGQPSGNSSGKQGEDGVDNGVVRSTPDGSLEEVVRSATRLSTTSRPTMEEVCREGDDLMRETSNRVKNGKDDGKDGDDGMEFEEGGGSDTST